MFAEVKYFLKQFKHAAKILVTELLINVHVSPELNEIKIINYQH